MMICYDNTIIIIIIIINHVLLLYYLSMLDRSTTLYTPTGLNVLD
jgi:hypothetical protein